MIRQALLSMGYSERTPGCWLKPIGYQCFSYHEGKNEWTNWFRSMQGIVERWETKNIPVDAASVAELIIFIKEFECWSRTNMYVNGTSHFELDTNEINL